MQTIEIIIIIINKNTNTIMNIKTVDFYSKQIMMHVISASDSVRNKFRPKNRVKMEELSQFCPDYAYFDYFSDGSSGPEWTT